MFTGMQRRKRKTHWCLRPKLTEHPFAGCSPMSPELKASERITRLRAHSATTKRDAIISIRPSQQPANLGALSAALDRSNQLLDLLLGHLSGTKSKPRSPFRWDFSSRWLNLPQLSEQNGERDLSTIDTISLIPVDLNALMYYNERTLQKLNCKYARGSQARSEFLTKCFWYGR